MSNMQEVERCLRIMNNLENLNWNALINRACDVGECLVVRWEAYRIALQDFDWFYVYATEDVIFRKGLDQFFLLLDAHRALRRVDSGRSYRMFGEARRDAMEKPND